jgi:membrane-associated phospholipid phosphatase
MHHPTDVIASAIGAAGCLVFALLATRTGAAVAEMDAEEKSAAPQPASPVSVVLPTGTSDVGVVP